VAAYRAYKPSEGLADLRAAVEDMHGIVHALRALPLAHAKALANRTNKEISRKPRANARKALKTAVLRLMRKYRLDDTEFKVFIRAWEAQTLGGLRLTPDGAGYLVTDENGDDLTRQVYAVGTLRLMYSRALNL
jgi:hypothetical protein